MLRAAAPPRGRAGRSLTATLFPTRLIPADLDGDGDVDGEDFTSFGACYNGANNPPAPTCPPGVDADFDNDGDVDNDDFAVMAQCYNGSNNRPAPACPQYEDPPASGTFVLHGRPVDVLSDGHALLYVRARYYDLTNGRWLQRDPNGYAGGANLYESLGSNAMRFVDPNGRIAEELINLILQGRFLSNAEIELALDRGGDVAVANARSRLIKNLREAGEALGDPTALALVPQGFEEGFRQPAIEATTARFLAFIDAQVAAGAEIEEVSSPLVLTTFFLGDLTGATQLGEGIFGVDLTSTANVALGPGESLRRAVQGGSTLVIIISGPKALETARQRTMLTSIARGALESEVPGLRFAAESLQRRGLRLTSRQARLRANQGIDLVVERRNFGILGANREFGAVEAKSGRFHLAKVQRGRQGSANVIASQLNRALEQAARGYRGFAQRRFIRRLQAELGGRSLLSISASARDRQLFFLDAEALAERPWLDFRTTTARNLSARTPFPPRAPLGSGPLNLSHSAGVAGVLFIIEDPDE